MACKQLHATTLDELTKLIAAHEASASQIFIYFTGAEDETTGNSWCPDCVRAEPVVEKCVKSLSEGVVFILCIVAEPVVEKCVKSLSEGVVFILCIVGDRPTWKDPNNPFRTHPKFKLNSIPALVKYNTPEKLGSEECAKEDLVRMLFED